LGSPVYSSAVRVDPIAPINSSVVPHLQARLAPTVLP
jgi:hypothetical protein